MSVVLRRAYPSQSRPHVKHGRSHSRRRLRDQSGDQRQGIAAGQREAFYVLEGEINVLVGERTIRATAGSFVLIPRGTVHTFSRIRQEPAKLLAIFSPAGFEQFFDEAVDLDVTDTEAYVAKGIALAEKYNMDIVGPPLEL